MKLWRWFKLWRKYGNRTFPEVTIVFRPNKDQAYECWLMPTGEHPRMRDRYNEPIPHVDFDTLSVRERMAAVSALFVAKQRQSYPYKQYSMR